MRRPRSPTEGPDQPSWPRQRCRGRTRGHARAPSGGDRVPVKVRELSVGDLSLTCGRHFPPGDVLGLSLVNSATGYGVEAMARVAYSIERRNGVFLVTGTFLVPLDEADVQALL